MKTTEWPKLWLVQKGRAKDTGRDLHVWKVEEVEIVHETKHEVHIKGRSGAMGRNTLFHTFFDTEAEALAHAIEIQTSWVQSLDGQLKEAQGFLNGLQEQQKFSKVMA